MSGAEELSAMERLHRMSKLKWINSCGGNINKNERSKNEGRGINIKKNRSGEGNKAKVVTYSSHPNIERDPLSIFEDKTWWNPPVIQPPSYANKDTQNANSRAWDYALDQQIPLEYLHILGLTGPPSPVQALDDLIALADYKFLVNNPKSNPFGLSNKDMYTIGIRNLNLALSNRKNMIKRYIIYIYHLELFINEYLGKLIYSGGREEME